MNAVRTVIAPADIKALVEKEYGLRDVSACTLHSVAVHDHYLIAGDGRRYMLRLYNAETSASPDHASGLFELELLAHLAAQGQPVTAPVARGGGAKFGRIDAAEGSRRYALFDFAEGRMIYPPSPAQARVLGARVAELHRAMTGFAGQQPAVTIELDQLVSDTAKAIQGAVGKHRQADLDFLALISADLKRSFNAFDALSRNSGAFGIVGDRFTGANNHWADDASPVFFNFSGSGRGWRAFDLAAFLWVTLIFGVPAEIWTAYLEGYESVRALDDVERAALPDLAKLKMLQAMAYHTKLTRWMGASFQDDAYWERHFGPLRRWHEGVSPR